MKMKMHGAVVLASLLLAGPAWGQTPYVKPVQEIAGDRVVEPPTETMPRSISRWLTPPPVLGEPRGESPPIATEVYMQSGFAIPVKSCFNQRDTLGRGMDLGWNIQGGVRTLFFDETATRAWVLDASISHVSNGHDRNRQYPLRVLEFTGNTLPNGNPEVALIQFGTPLLPGIVVRNTDRTYVNGGVGRDWFLGSTEDSPGRNLRVGWQVGGRYGTLSQKYDILKHRTDVIGGVFAGVHGEVEIPNRFGVFSAGVRTEWGYTWADIFQVASDVQEINVLFTFGLRF